MLEIIPHEYNELFSSREAKIYVVYTENIPINLDKGKIVPCRLLIVSDGSRVEIPGELYRGEAARGFGGAKILPHVNVAIFQNQDIGIIEKIKISDTPISQENSRARKALLGRVGG